MKLRMRFVKVGSMKFLGHLDVMRYFQKAFRRCEFPVAYSQGYSPHPQMSFASPLGVGLTSEGEYLDVEATEKFDELPASQWITRINQAMNEELYITQIVILADTVQPSMALLAAADYMIYLKPSKVFIEDWVDLLIKWSEQEQILVIKKTKKSEKEMDIRPFLYEVSKCNRDGEAALKLQLAAGSVMNIKPELVLEAFCEQQGMEFHSTDFQIHRMDMFQDLGAAKGEIHSNEERELRQLISLGECE